MAIEQEVVDWFHTRPEWQQEAISRILANGHLSSSDLDELITLYISEEGKKITNTRIFPGFDGHTDEDKTLRIISIGDIQGIENLKPRKPLSFDKGNLVVIYGGNGSGKSGYVRIMKKACGKENAKDLLCNVFEEVPNSQSCKIEYQTGGLENTKDWIAKGNKLSDLIGVDIFDSESGLLYLSREKGASYIPKSLAIFDELVQVCDKIKNQLQHEKNSLPSKLPAIPPEFEYTQAGKLYRNLRPDYTESQLTAILPWTEEDQQNLVGIEERLKTEDLSKLAATKRSRKSQVGIILNTITSALSAFSPEAAQKIVDLKIKSKKKFKR